ncbi:MAG: tRNA (N(6)-L-threonylcarbamoyladenosine(37)-C(2))-methylthiotransferase MtaB [Chloroflexi bacterium]|nr:tRNA (N(6)-L-threonylcarbamoyladenosine(37)-C(2))-methylthiotransferase MtaB [Chloroflexota bacterium]MCY3937711.1 tRNA (N(6)-L-threonylcarbamoyladenosine(37)-C(2))-methylthiotransferase MtaB [Chloroflexota bacterium]
MGRPGPTVAVKTLGCRVNQTDSDSILRALVDRGFYPAAQGQPADAVVVNTCTVTHVADRKSRHAIARGIRDNPDCVVAVTGCYASVDAERLRRSFPRALIFSPVDQNSLIEEVSRAANAPGIAAPAGDGRRFGERGRIRPMIKAQEGCDHICAFCIIPRARGRSTSRTLRQVIADVVRFAEAGANEVVLTGVSIGSYRCPETGLRLADMIARVASETGVARLRLSSIEPIEFDDGIFQLLADGTICPHLHIPIQSGSDRTLRRMRRKYAIADYERIVTSARAANPDVAIATDVMVGFPGESQNDFEASFDFIAAMEFAYLHVFPYSMRPRTVAAHMKQGVRDDEKKARVQAMIDLGERQREDYAQRFVGRSRTVLWESVVDGQGTGVTDNFLKVSGRSKATPGSLETVMLAPGAWGELVAIGPAGQPRLGG